MIDVSLYVERITHLQRGGVYGFVFHDAYYRKEHDQRGELESSTDFERNCEGLAKLLSYAIDNKMDELCIRTWSYKIFSLIDIYNRRLEFQKNLRTFPSSFPLFSRVFDLCKCFRKLEIEVIGSADIMLHEALGLANALCVYTDGSCLDNGQPYARAGAAIYFGPNHHLNQKFKVSGKQTNNRAEYTAIVGALETAISEHRNYLIIYTDCNLIIKTMNCYIHTWKNRGWRNAKGKPVDNQDLVMRIDDLMDKINYVKFVKVAAHKSNQYNNEVDRMAKQAACYLL